MKSGRPHEILFGDTGVMYIDRSPPAHAIACTRGGGSGSGFWAPGKGTAKKLNLRRGVSSRHFCRASVLVLRQFIFRRAADTKGRPISQGASIAAIWTQGVSLLSQVSSGMIPGLQGASLLGHSALRPNRLCHARETQLTLPLLNRGSEQRPAATRAHLRSARYP